MKTADFRSGDRAIRIAGVLLILYLISLIAFSYLGQGRLHESLIEQQRQSLAYQAAAIGQQLNLYSEALGLLGTQPAVSAFLQSYAEQPAGDAIASEREQLKKTLEARLNVGADNQSPIYRRIALLDADGHAILEVGSQEPLDPGSTYRLNAPDKLTSLQLASQGGTPIIRIHVSLNEKPEPTHGALVADLGADALLLKFARGGSAKASKLHIGLVDPNGQVIATNDGSAPGTWRERLVRRDAGTIDGSVPGTHLGLVAYSESRDVLGFLTTPLFLLALGVFSVPVLIGASYLLRMNNHNLVLQTRTQSIARQRTLLRKQNERLQREIDMRVESEEKLTHQANYDQLTGLPNRNLAIDRLAQAIKRARRDDGTVIVMFLDLDRFKQVNDSLGHAAGDELLREAAKRLQTRIRESDTVSRLGGDEFLVICSDDHDRPQWEQLSQQLLRVLSQPFYIGDHEFYVGASIGIAAYPDGGTEPARLLKNADIAMYAAKDQGRNRCCFYDPSMDSIALETMRLETNLRHAMERDELYLEYQPIVELSSGRTIAVEALLRWRSAELGQIPPDKFIPIAEETGLIHEIGEWVLLEACRTIGAMQPDPDFRIAVNLSTKQFSRPGRLLDCTLYALQVSGLMPSQLEMEITESVLIDDRPEIANLINQLERIGIRLSIDDFGTGYSALNYLQRFPFDVLKIDRSFTSQVPDNAASASLIRAIIAMAHALGLSVIAEGIESRNQAGFLLVHHCEFGQGYLYSRPLRAEQLRRHLSGEEAMSA